MSTDLVKKELGPTELANIEKELMQEARDVAAKERIVVPAIKVRQGRMLIADQEVADNKLTAVILDSVHVNAIYENDFDEDNKEPPCCYAIDSDEDELEHAPGVRGYPELDAKKRQTGNFIIHEGPCKTCPMNQFGSAEKGKGKACGNRRKLAIMAASDLTSEATIRGAEVYTISIPPTSLQIWAVYVKGIRDNFNRPPFAMITEISTVPFKTFYKWVFKPIDKLPMEMIGALKAKQNAVKDVLWQGWDLTPKAPEADAPATASGKF